MFFGFFTTSSVSGCVASRRAGVASRSVPRALRRSHASVGRPQVAAPPRRIVANVRSRCFPSRARARPLCFPPPTPRRAARRAPRAAPQRSASNRCSSFAPCSLCLQGRSPERLRHFTRGAPGRGTKQRSSPIRTGKALQRVTASRRAVLFPEFGPSLWFFFFFFFNRRWPLTSVFQKQKAPSSPKLLH